MLCPDVFFNTISIWIEKPHLVHPHIFGANINRVDGIIVSRIVVPKKKVPVTSFTEQLTIADLRIRFSSDLVTYDIFLDEDHVSVEVLNYAEGGLFTANWLKSDLGLKLNHWLKLNPQRKPPSLSLIDVSSYQTIYFELKQKYSEKLLENWCERTDPVKFTFEDLGIAAYLISLWRCDSGKPVFFVDIGCGNGLLVYILVMEGFRGRGIDLRERKIWATYPDSVRQCLQVASLNPDYSTGYPEATWLIGNHSDELTPWLPILATRSGSECSVFALPCCPYGLFGKYNGILHNTPDNSPLDGSEKGSVYRRYLAYLRTLFHLCGFQPETDTLRIPSTKKICIVGRKLLPRSHADRLSELQRIIDIEKSVVTCTGFQPRPSVEPVMNCAGISSEIKEAVTQRIFQALLHTKVDFALFAFHNVVCSSDGHVRTTDDRWWYPGGLLPLNEVASLLHPHELEAMKSQHGGLQTFLRNQNQVFQVIKGTVRLRWSPERMKQQPPECVKPDLMMKVPTKRLTKPCWMLQHHPNGCPYPASLCDFLHDDLESKSVH